MKILFILILCFCVAPHLFAQNVDEVWEWGNLPKPHSKVKFDADGKVVHIYSVASTGKDGWTRA